MAQVSGLKVCGFQVGMLIIDTDLITSKPYNLRS
jgi:hypothetical protein